LFCDNRQSGEQRYKGGADDGNTAAAKSCFMPWDFAPGLSFAVALKLIDCTPDAKTCAQSDNESLKNGYCAIEKCHNISS
jgi:hypothetical protein